MSLMKLDVLAFGAHPDDVELSCGGTLAKLASQGKKVGIIDLTYGDLGTRGTVEIRLQEAKEAAAILGAVVRENLGFRDGFFYNDEYHQKKVIEVIRKYQPEIILANALEDRHPDHGKGAELLNDAAFLSGLRRIETAFEGQSQDAWRPRRILHYQQFRHINPDILVDISGYMDLKMKSIKAHRSQFHDPNSNEPKTLISSPIFLQTIENKALEYGQYIGTQHAEGFNVKGFLGVRDLLDVL
jgi:bacillithiol biosynthesis deacetylase BshB1